MNEVTVRDGKREDCEQVMALIRELAEYERAPHEVSNTVAQLEEDGFGPNPSYRLIVAEQNKRIVGISLWFIRYSTWKGKTLYLEDIVVSEKMRGRGIGKLLFDETIRAAKREKLNGLRWQVLNWNEPAINFYRKYNAQFDDEWLNGSLSKEQIESF